MIAKILNIEWLTGSFGSIGVVLIENEMGEQSARIGIAPVRFGGDNTKKEDADFIAEHGRKLIFAQAKGFFPDIEKEKYKKY